MIFKFMLHTLKYLSCHNNVEVEFANTCIPLRGWTSRMDDKSTRLNNQCVLMTALICKNTDFISDLILKGAI